MNEKEFEKLQEQYYLDMYGTTDIDEILKSIAYQEECARIARCEEADLEF